MKVLIDCGNQRIKWAFSENNVLHTLFAAEASGFFDAFQSAYEALGTHIECAVIASVNIEATDKVVHSLSDLNIPWRMAAIKPGLGGLILGYDRPEQLGIDRYFALLGAVSQAPCLVIDAGTALTVDKLTITPEGYLHAGGIVAPGRREMYDALQTQTAIRLGEDTEISEPLLWGRNTAQCVHQGVHQSQTGLINQLYRKEQMRIVGCGGDFPALQAHLEAEEIYHLPKLVLSGLLRYEQWHQEFT